MRKASEVVVGNIGSVEYIDFDDMVLVKDSDGKPMFTMVISDEEIFDADENCLELDISEDAIQEIFARVLNILKTQEGI